MSARLRFSADTFAFLNELRDNNSRDWFDTQRSRYEQVVREPYLQLIADLQAPLAQISPHFQADTRRQGGSLFRQHRDTRFRRDKSPYKYWAGAKFFHERRREIDAPSFFMHIQPQRCFVGGGLRMPQSSTLQRVRSFIVDNPRAWKSAAHDPQLRAHFDQSGPTLVRAPRGHDINHELIVDLRRKNYMAVRYFEDELALSEELPDWIAAQLRQVAPLVDYLCAALDLDF